MRKKPNFSTAGSQAVNGFSSEPFVDVRQSKPFDGFKTSSLNKPRKPFDFQSNTDYNSNIMSVKGMENKIRKEIDDLDWELNSHAKRIDNFSKPTETTSKPNLFMKKTKKSDFNNTGETKATAGLNTNDWDLSEENPKQFTSVKALPKKPVSKPVPMQQADDDDWNLESARSKPKPFASSKPAVVYATKK